MPPPHGRSPRQNKNTAPIKFTTVVNLKSNPPSQLQPAKSKFDTVSNLTFSQFVTMRQTYCFDPDARSLPSGNASSPFSVRPSRNAIQIHHCGEFDPRRAVLPKIRATRRSPKKAAPWRWRAPTPWLARRSRTQNFRSMHPGHDTVSHLFLDARCMNVSWCHSGQRGGRERELIDGGDEVLRHPTTGACVRGAG